MLGLHVMLGVLSYVMNLVYVEGCGMSSGEYCVPLGLGLVGKMTQDVGMV